MEIKDLKAEDQTASKEITEKEDSISKVAFIERGLFHATMDKMFKNVDNIFGQHKQLIGHVDSLVDKQNRLMGIVESVVARVEKIETRLKEEAPAKADDRAEAPSPDQDRSDESVEVLHNNS